MVSGSCGNVWKKTRRPHSLRNEENAASGRSLWELRLKVKLQSELKNTRIAYRAGKDSERRRPECGAGGSEVRMIENVEGFRTEREAVFFRE